MGFENWLIAQTPISSNDHKRIRLDDKLMFLQQLTALVSSGTPLAEALEITAQQSRSIQLRRVLEEIATALAGGCPIGSVLADYRHVFEDRWIRLIGMGEASGKLDIVLADLNRQMHKSYQRRCKTVRTLMRPIVWLGVAALIVAAVVWLVVPTVANTLDRITSRLPEATPSLLSPVIESIAGSDSLQQLLKASQSASPGVAGPNDLGPKRNTADGLSSLRLNATYIQGDRRLALIDGRVYEQGESLAISDSMPEPCIVAQISADRVLIRHQDRTVELKYANPAVSTDSAPGARKIEQGNLRLDLLPSILLQHKETDYGH